MAQKTANYQLYLWEPEDNFLRTEFNENFAKIDAAIPHIAAGAYTGNGGSSASTTAKTQTISLGFHPKAVLVYPVDGMAYINTGNYGYKNVYSALATREQNAAVNGLSALTITESGFTVNFQSKNAELNTYSSEDRPATNYGSKVYNYIALG